MAHRKLGPTGRSIGARQRLAEEAARLMAESGRDDFSEARRKIAARHGLRDKDGLPDEREIAAALATHQRLFSPRQPDVLHRLRQSAAQAMQALACFQPRLAGSVLEGTADRHSVVELHLHCDEAEAVMRFLDERGVAFEIRSRRLRLQRGRATEFTALHLNVEGTPMTLTVLPEDALRQPPLEASGRQPMRRASGAELARLLANASGPVG